MAFSVAEDYRKETGDEAPMLVVSTASPYKFAADVAAAIQVPVTDDAFAAAEALEAVTRVPAPDQVAQLRSLPVLHTRICEKDRMGEAVLAGFTE